MDGEKNYDDLLYPILCSEQEITGFLDRIFDFLHRRTDFYEIQSGSQISRGLPIGVAEKLVKNAFLKYKLAQAENIAISEDTTTDYLADYAAEEVVSSTTMDANGDNAYSNKESEDAVNTERAKPVQENEEKVYVSDPKCYNGAQYNNYCWSQTLNDADLQIKVPLGVNSGRHVRINIKQQHIKAEAFENDEWKVLLDDELKWKISTEESMWTLVPQDHIHVFLEKVQKRWWERMFVSEPEINIRAIDASQPYEELDAESRAKIQELMYNEHQKRLGKPTSEQEKVADVLKEAWDKENSPFKGHPFDPSIVDICDSQSCPSMPK